MPSLYLLLPILDFPSDKLTLVIIATSLCAGSFASTSAAYNHYKEKNVIVKDAFILSAGSFITAIIFPKFVVHINPILLKYVISLVLILVASNMILAPDKVENKNTLLSKKFLFPSGLMAGAFSSVTGLGGGIIFIPLLIYLFGVDIKKAVGTSVIAVAVTMITSSLSYAFIHKHGFDLPVYFGLINVPIGLLLGLSSIFGAMIGVKLNINIRGTVLKKIFSIFLLIVVVKIILN